MAKLSHRDRFRWSAVRPLATRQAAVLSLLLAVLPSCVSREGDPKWVYSQIVRLRRSDPKNARASALKAYRRFQHDSAETAWPFRLLSAELLLDASQFAPAESLLREDPPLGPRHDELAARLSVSRLRLQSKKGDWTQAERLQGEATRLLRLSPDPCLSVQLLAIDIRHLIVGSHLAESEKRLAEMEGLTKSCADQYWEATRIYLTGTKLFAEFRVEEAIESYGRALILSRQGDLKTLAPLVLGDLASCHLYLGDADMAIEQLDEAEKLYAQTEQDFDESIDRGRRGMIYALRRQYDLASAEYRKALQGAKMANHRAYEAQWLNTLTALECDAGDVASAESANNDAIAIAEPLKNLKEWTELYATAQLNRARIARLHKDVARAYRLIQPLNAYRESKYFEWQYQAERAQLLAVMNRAGEARKQFQGAIDTAESARSEVKDVWYRITFSSQILDLYRRYVDFLIEHKDFEEALRVVDSSHARQLLEKLHSTEKVDEVADFRRVARGQHAIILSYWVSNERSYMWVTTDQLSRMFPLGDTRKLAGQIQNYRQQIESGADFLQNPQSSIALYRQLIAPAAAMIPGDATVIVIPDGPLADLNFETLIAPDSPKRYWLDTVSVRIAPSLTLLHRTEPPQVEIASLLLVGGTQPPKPFEALPGSQREIDTINTLFHSANPRVLSGAGATPEEFLRARPGEYSLIHISAHAVAVKESPLDSSIILTPDKPNSNFRLYARQLAGMKLRADLVTLSSCRGAGAKTVPGEGLVGLTWALLRAGAHNVVAGLWNVPDKATAKLMGYFYSCLRGGDTPSQALRSAKLQMLRQHAPPYYWAAFQLYSH